MRVAMLARSVYPLHGYGGVERHVYHLTRHLARLGVEVHLWVQENAPGTPMDLGPRIFLHPVRYDRTSPWLRPNSILGRQINYPLYSWQIGRQAAAWVRAGRVDLVHAQGLAAFGYGRLRAHDRSLYMAAPMIMNPHGMEEYKTPSRAKRLAYLFFRSLYSYGARCADRVIATDVCTRGEVSRYLGVHPSRVVVLPSAIDVSECLAPLDPALQSALRQRLGLGGAPLVLLSVSRLERNKGFHLLAEALAGIWDRLPEGWRWVIVGEGKERPALEAQVRRQGLGAATCFAGHLDDRELHNLYEVADLLVHPTLYEGSSLVVLEGMVHRRPVLATAAGGIPDKVFDGRNGRLVPPGDVPALREGLLWLLEQRSRWPEMGAEGERIVRERFDWPIVARATYQVYQDMLERCRQPT
ncbi:MAG: glycosyltransferase family 4 protein [Chloroflexia bacterium]